MNLLMREVKKRWGIILAMYAIPLASVINEFLRGKFHITNLIFFVIPFLLLDFKNLRKKDFMLSKDLIFIMLFQVYVTALAVFKGEGLFTQASGIIYTLFSIVIILCLSTSRTLEEPEQFVRTLWIVMGVFNLLLFVIITDYLTKFSSLSFVWTKYGADRLTLSNIVFGFILVSLVYKPRTVKEILFGICCWGAVVINMLACGKRGSLIAIGGVLLAYFLYHFKSTWIRKKTLYRIICSFLVLALCIYILMKIMPDAFNVAMEYVYSIWRGVKNLLHIGNEVDVSTSIRNEIREEIFFLLRSDTSFMQWIFGRGYHFKYLDFPILQSFVDLGIIGGLAYCYIQLIIPISYIFKRNVNCAFRIIQYYTIFLLFNIFYAGIPYGYGKFISIILLCSSLFSKCKKEEMQDKEQKNAKGVYSYQLEDRITN